MNRGPVRRVQVKLQREYPAHRGKYSCTSPCFPHSLGSAPVQTGLMYRRAHPSASGYYTEGRLSATVPGLGYRTGAEHDKGRVAWDGDPASEEGGTGQCELCRTHPGTSRTLYGARKARGIGRMTHLLLESC